MDELDIAWQMRESYHRALWEEEKHFTWLSSILFGAQLAFLTAARLDDDVRHLAVVVLASFGSLFAIMAIAVIRAEGRNFVEARDRFMVIYNSRFTERPLPVVQSAFVPPTRPYALPDRILRIRDIFQAVFVLFFLLNVATIGLILIGAA